MSTPPLSKELMQEALAAVAEHGTKAAAARALDIPETTLRHRVKKAHQFITPEQGDKCRDFGIHPEHLRGGWIKDEGASYRFSIPEQEQDSIIDKIEGRFLNIPPAPSIIRPKDTKESLRAFYPLFDAHLAMKFGDHGLQAAVDRIEEGMAELLGRTDRAASALILNGGDFTHQDDSFNQTVKSKNALDVDGDYDDTIDAAVCVTVHLIEMALQNHDTVIYKAIKGNHDPHTAIVLTAALEQRYRETDRVTIETGRNKDFYLHEWGKMFLGAQHGDAKGGTVKDLILAFAARYSGAWGRTKFREVWTGHNHHLKAQEVAGAVHYQARAITPPDSHVRKNKFTSQSEMQSVVYHKQYGRRGGALHIFPDVDWSE